MLNKGAARVLAALEQLLRHLQKMKGNPISEVPLNPPLYTAIQIGMQHIGIVMAASAAANNGSQARTQESQRLLIDAEHQMDCLPAVRLLIFHTVPTSSRFLFQYNTDLLSLATAPGKLSQFVYFYGNSNFLDIPPETR